MIDLFKKILSAVVSQAGTDGQANRLERELAKKFDALHGEVRRDNAKRWVFLFFICALVVLAAFFGYRQMKREVRSMVAEELDKEFSSTYLQKAIEDSAKKYTALQLKEYVDTQFAAQYKLHKLEAMARMDSRKAFEQLSALAIDPKLKDDAQLGISAIIKKYATLVYPFTAREAGVREEQKDDKSRPDGGGALVPLELHAFHADEPSMDALRAGLHHLAQESQKNYLVPDFIKFLRESDSLGASIGICRILEHHYGNQASDTDFEKWIQYLEGVDKNAVKLSGISK